jgi:hypothetical protein
VRKRIEYRFRVPSATVFTLYSYCKDLEYRFRLATAGSLTGFPSALASALATKEMCSHVTLRVGHRVGCERGPRVSQGHCLLAVAGCSTEGGVDKRGAHASLSSPGPLSDGCARYDAPAPRFLHFLSFRSPAAATHHMLLRDAARLSARCVCFAGAGGGRDPDLLSS